MTGGSEVHLTETENEAKSTFFFQNGQVHFYLIPGVF